MTPRKLKQSDLKLISFHSGDVELQQFPQHLRKALEENCRIMQTRNPTCTRPFQDESIHDYHGRQAYFQVKESREKMFQAKYKYGNNGQITVAQERLGKIICRGRAVIIVNTRGYPCPYTDSDNETFSQVNYQIWVPGAPTKQPPTESVCIVRLIKVEKSHEPETQLRILDSVAVVAAGKSDPTTFDNRSHASASDKTELSESDTPLMKISRRTYNQHTDQSPGTSGGVPYSFLSPSQSKVIQEDGTENLKRGFIQSPSLGPSSASSCITGATPGQVAWLSTPLVSDLAGDSLFNPSQSTRSIHERSKFLFKQSQDSTVLRTKSISICNTVQKLFAQAKAAGIINKDSMAIQLLTTIDTGRLSAYVIRDDPEDFETFMQEVGSSKNDIQEILVLPGDD